MFNRIKYLFILLAVALSASCEELRFGDDFLEMPAGNEDNLDVVFSSAENAEQALVTAYATLPDMMITKLSYDFLESLTDLNNGSMGWGPMRSTYYPGQLNSSTAEGNLHYRYSTGGWPGIRAAWVFIENVDRVPDMTDINKEIRKAEAKVIIAIHYLDMFRCFGGVPWIDHSYKPGEDMSHLPRMTVEETVSRIVTLLDEAAAVLPWSVDAANDGRMTKAAALGLKVRTLLFAASPIFNDDVPYLDGEAAAAHLVWYGNKSMERWDAVVTACEEFLRELELNGWYAMVDTGNPREDFRKAYFERYNGEVLVSTRRRTKYPGLWSEKNSFMETPLYGTGNTTLDYVDMFPMKDGTDFDWDNPEHAAHPFFDASGAEVRDPRLYETTNVNGDAWQGRTVESWIGGRERPNEVYEKQLFASGFAIRKFRQDVNSSAGQFYSWPYLRLPEIFLSYAEALNEVGRTSEAYEYLNRTRKRVGVTPVASGLSTDEFREAVLRERALEFGYEEVRFYDLVRWKRDDLFRKKLHGLNIRSADKGVTLTYERFEIPMSRAWQGDGWNPKWYFLPLPIAEVNKKYGLIQNPGW